MFHPVNNPMILRTSVSLKVCVLFSINTGNSFNDILSLGPLTQEKLTISSWYSCSVRPELRYRLNSFTYGTKSENPGLFSRYSTISGAAQKQSTRDVLEYSKGNGQEAARQWRTEFPCVVPLSMSSLSGLHWLTRVGSLVHIGFPWSLKVDILILSSRGSRKIKWKEVRIE